MLLGTLVSRLYCFSSLVLFVACQLFDIFPKSVFFVLFLFCSIAHRVLLNYLSYYWCLASFFCLLFLNLHTYLSVVLLCCPLGWFSSGLPFLSVWVFSVKVRKYSLSAWIVGVRYILWFCVFVSAFKGNQKGNFSKVDSKVGFCWTLVSVLFKGNVFYVWSLGAVWSFHYEAAHVWQNTSYGNFKTGFKTKMTQLLKFKEPGWDEFKFRGDFGINGIVRGMFL